MKLITTNDRKNSYRMKTYIIIYTCMRLRFDTKTYKLLHLRVIPKIRVNSVMI